jgi:hypothetical protein
MQSSKLLLLGILSQLPRPYEYQTPPVLGLELETDCSLTASYTTIPSTQNATAGIFESGTSGIVVVTFTNTGESGVIVIMPELVTGLELPFCWDQMYPFIEPGHSMEVTAEYTVTALTGEVIEFKFLGCPAPLDAIVGGTPAGVDDWSVLADFEGATSHATVNLIRVNVKSSAPAFYTYPDYATFDHSSVYVGQLPKTYGHISHMTDPLATTDYDQIVGFVLGTSLQAFSFNDQGGISASVTDACARLIVQQQDSGTGFDVERIIASATTTTLSLKYRRLLDEDFTEVNVDLNPTLVAGIEYKLRVNATLTGIKVMIDNVVKIDQPTSIPPLEWNTDELVAHYIVVNDHQAAFVSASTSGADVGSPGPGAGPGPWSAIDMFDGTPGTPVSVYRTLEVTGSLAGQYVFWNWDYPANAMILDGLGSAIVGDDATGAVAEFFMHTDEVVKAELVPTYSGSLEFKPLVPGTPYLTMPWYSNTYMAISLWINNSVGDIADLSIYVYQDRVALRSAYDVGFTTDDVSEDVPFILTTEPVKLEISVFPQELRIEYRLNDNLIGNHTNVKIPYDKTTNFDFYNWFGLNTRADNMKLSGTRTLSVSDMPVVDGLHRLWDVRDATSDGMTDKIAGQSIVFNQSLSSGQAIQMKIEGDQGWMQPTIYLESGNSGTALGIIEGGYTPPIGSYSFFIIGSPMQNYGTDVGPSANVDTILGTSDPFGIGAGLNQVQNQGVAIRSYDDPGYTFGIGDWRDSRSIIIVYDSSNRHWQAFVDGTLQHSMDLPADVAPPTYTDFFPVNDWTQTKYQLGLYAVYERPLSMNEVNDLTRYVETDWGAAS